MVIKATNYSQVCDFDYWQRCIFTSIKNQFKNNIADSIWPFHRDFPFWNIFDHIDLNRMINFVIYLDDVNESSGAINFIPKSHKHFLERELQNSKMIYSLEVSSSNDLLFAFFRRRDIVIHLKIRKNECPK